MDRLRRPPAAIPLAAALLAAGVLGACGDDTVPLTQNTQVISEIPWTAPETARYRIMSGDDEAGSGELKVEQQAGALLVTQRFRALEDNITDDVSALVDAGTVRPRSVERVISGPEGERRCQATYEEGAVVVEQRSGEDERTDRVELPGRAYEGWADLFLWRTIAFAEGFEATYSGVLSCALVKPQVIRVVLQVKGIESITVPAGTFEVWRLEIRSGGETTKAWYANDARRTLVRYDNGRHVFELESVK